MRRIDSPTRRCDSANYEDGSVRCCDDGHVAEGPSLEPLATGDLHPAIEGGLNKNLGTGKGCLGRLAERDPARNGVGKSGAR
jgi:hypothetical protein